MKVLVRIPRRVVHEIPGRHTVADVLRQLRMNPESVIVIRGRELLTPDVMLEDDAEIEVRLAISGGSPRREGVP